MTDDHRQNLIEKVAKVIESTQYSHNYREARHAAQELIAAGFIRETDNRTEIERFDDYCRRLRIHTYSELLQLIEDTADEMITDEAAKIVRETDNTGNDDKDSSLESAAEDYRDETGWNLPQGRAVQHAFIAGAQWARSSGVADTVQLAWNEWEKQTGYWIEDMESEPSDEFAFAFKRGQKSSKA